MNRWSLIVLTSLFAMLGCVDTFTGPAPEPEPEDDSGEFAPGAVLGSELDGSPAIGTPPSSRRRAAGALLRESDGR